MPDGVLEPRVGRPPRLALPPDHAFSGAERDGCRLGHHGTRARLGAVDWSADPAAGRVRSCRWRPSGGLSRTGANCAKIPLESDWQPMPDPHLMKVTNPFKRSGQALAFKVSRVFVPLTQPPFPVEWYWKAQNIWCPDHVPTRGEFLIRRGGTHRPRRVRAVLELSAPYLAVLRPAD